MSDAEKAMAFAQALIDLPMVNLSKMLSEEGKEKIAKSLQESETFNQWLYPDRHAGGLDPSRTAMENNSKEPQ